MSTKSCDWFSYHACPSVPREIAPERDETLTPNDRTKPEHVLCDVTARTRGAARANASKRARCGTAGSPKRRENGK